MKLVEHKRANVLKQIDFYFSDSNLPFDKFLKGECQAEGGCANPCLRMRDSTPPKNRTEWKGPDAVTDEAIQLVSEIMKESDIVEISDDQYRIRRKDVRLLKYSDVGGSGCFRGCALVEMSSTEEATAMLSTSLEYEGSTLRMQSKARKEQKDLNTADVWRPVLMVEGLPPDPPSAKEENDPAQPSTGQHAGEADGKTAEKEETEDQPADQMKQHVVKDDEKDQLVRFEVVGDTDGFPSGRDLRDVLGGQTKGIRFVEHPAGTHTGVIRCKDAEHASAFVKECGESGELEISSGHKLKLSMITGDEEAAVWTKIHAAAAGRAGKRPARGGRGVGGRHVKRGRR